MGYSKGSNTDPGLENSSCKGCGGQRRLVPIGHCCVLKVEERKGDLETGKKRMARRGPPTRSKWIDRL